MFGGKRKPLNQPDLLLTLVTIVVEEEGAPQRGSSRTIYFILFNFQSLIVLVGINVIY